MIPQPEPQQPRTNPRQCRPWGQGGTPRGGESPSAGSLPRPTGAQTPLRPGPSPGLPNSVSKVPSARNTLMAPAPRSPTAILPSGRIAAALALSKRERAIAAGPLRTGEGFDMRVIPCGEEGGPNAPATLSTGAESALPTLPSDLHAPTPTPGVWPGCMPTAPPRPPQKQAPSPGHEYCPHPGGS